MIGAEWLAGLGGVAAFTSACFAAWAKFSQQKTSNIQQVYEAMKEHMVTLAEENKDLRQRQTNHGHQMQQLQQLVNDLRIETAVCEADKQALSVEVARLKEQINGRH